MDIIVKLLFSLPKILKGIVLLIKRKKKQKGVTQNWKRQKRDKLVKKKKKPIMLKHTELQLERK
jgi:hypothetical protein